MKRVFLSLPMTGKSNTWINENVEAMKRNYDAMVGEKVIYICSHGTTMPADTFVDLGLNSSVDFDKATQVWFLGEAIKKLGTCNDVVFHPESNISNGCRVEKSVSAYYGILSTNLRDEKFKLLDYISVTIREEGLNKHVEGNIYRILDDMSIWTKELFMETPIIDFEEQKGAGPATLRCIEYVQIHMKEAKARR